MLNQRHDRTDAKCVQRNHRSSRFPTLSVMTVAVCVALAAVSCTRPVQDSEGPVTGDETSNVSTTEVPLDVLTVDEDEDASNEPLAGTAILDIAKPNVVLVWTWAGLGSGVVLPTGHIVTNSHVVEPYSSVFVSSPDGSVRDEPVAVIGADIEADLAVLEPLSDYDVDGLGFSSAESLDQGSEVFLVGYPGEVDFEDLNVTIASGLFSRTRQTQTFDITMIQTDADIAGGQSGGALLDDRGHLIGISALPFTEAFALAIDGSRAAESIQAILAGTATTYLPSDDEDREFDLNFNHPYEVKRLTFEAGGKERTVELDVDGADLSIRAFNIYSDESWANQAALNAPGTQLFSVADSNELDTLTFGLAAYERLVIDVATADGSTGSATVTSNIAGSLRDEGERSTVSVGDTVSGTVQPGQPYEAWSIELAEGQTVRAVVGSGVGDPGLWMLAADEEWNIENWVDDSGLGLRGLDPEIEFTAPAAGTYRMVVESVDTFAMAYELTVS